VFEATYVVGSNIIGHYTYILMHDAQEIKCSTNLNSIPIQAESEKILPTIRFESRSLGMKSNI
jgi:hypothetical protein